MKRKMSESLSKAVLCTQTPAPNKVSRFDVPREIVNQLPRTFDLGVKIPDVDEAGPSGSSENTENSITISNCNNFVIKISK